ncbi:putative ribonuclease h protein, partial [Quercus suber]
GQCIGGFAKACVVTSSLAAELWALQEGLLCCIELHAQAVELKLDVVATLSLMSCNARTNGDFSILVDDCKDLLLQLPQVKIMHCFREANYCADALAIMGSANCDVEISFEGLLRCIELHAQAVELELDAVAAQSLTSCNARTNGDFSILVDDCRDLLLQLPQVKILHCFREANCCVDALAIMGSANCDVEISFVTPPPMLISLLESDMLGIYHPRLCTTLADPSV